MDFSGVEAPALALVALQRQHPGVPPSASVELRARAETFWRTAVVPLQNRWIEEFRRQVPQARVVILQDAEHTLHRTRTGGPEGTASVLRGTSVRPGEWRCDAVWGPWTAQRQCRV